MDLFAAIAIIVSVIGFCLILATVFLVYKYQAYKINRQNSSDEKVTTPMRKVRVRRGRIVSAAETLPPRPHSQSPPGRGSLSGSRRMAPGFALGKGEDEFIRDSQTFSDAGRAENGLMPSERWPNAISRRENLPIAAPFGLPVSSTMMNRPNKPPRIYLPRQRQSDAWPLPQSHFSMISRSSPILEAQEEDSDAPSLIEDKSPDMGTPRTASLQRRPSGSWYLRGQNQISMYGSTTMHHGEKSWTDPIIGDASVPVEMGTAAVMSIARAHMEEPPFSHIRQQFLRDSQPSVDSIGSPVSPISATANSSTDAISPAPRPLSSAPSIFAAPIPEVGSISSHRDSQNESDHRSSGTDREFSTPTEYPRDNKVSTFMQGPDTAPRMAYRLDSEEDVQRAEFETFDRFGGRSSRVFNSPRLTLDDLHRVFSLPVEDTPA